MTARQLPSGPSNRRACHAARRHDRSGRVPPPPGAPAQGQAAGAAAHCFENLEHFENLEQSCRSGTSRSRAYTRAPARLLSLRREFKNEKRERGHQLPRAWLEAAAAERQRAGLPEVNLEVEHAKFIAWFARQGSRGPARELARLGAAGVAGPHQHPGPYPGPRKGKGPSSARAWRRGGARRAEATRPPAPVFRDRALALEPRASPRRIGLPLPSRAGRRLQIICQRQRFLLTGSLANGKVASLQSNLRNGPHD